MCVIEVWMYVFWSLFWFLSLCSWLRAEDRTGNFLFFPVYSQLKVRAAL